MNYRVNARVPVGRLIPRLRPPACTPHDIPPLSKGLRVAHRNPTDTALPVGLGVRQFADVVRRADTVLNGANPRPEGVEGVRPGVRCVVARSTEEVPDRVQSIGPEPAVLPTSTDVTQGVGVGRVVA